MIVMLFVWGCGIAAIVGIARTLRAAGPELKDGRW